MLRESLEVSIEGFSGPLDLLCHMVESRQMQASKIKVAQLVRIYGAYLAKTKKASMDTLAEFFFMAAELLLQKTLALLPSAPEEQAEDTELPIDEEELLLRLARYRPYRAATAWLEERKTRQDRCYRRIAAEEEVYQGEPIYDIGDLYFLCRLWWGLIDKKSVSVKHLAFDDSFADEEWDGMPEAVPEESQIQGRIAELEEKLSENSTLSFNELWAVSPSIKVLVVTLLAVLEMCRMGKITIEQEMLFSDVKIYAKC
ncbi:MAG: segregation/condensation protein A [Synergistaceae bacterium]|jgi:segregation and condensation protein A|nr:segregation/condensation protein A [Synergistaceae bacterium]